MRKRTMLDDENMSSSWIVAAFSWMQALGSLRESLSECGCGSYGVTVKVKKKV